MSLAEFNWAAQQEVDCPSERLFLLKAADGYCWHERPIDRYFVIGDDNIDSWLAWCCVDDLEPIIKSLSDQELIVRIPKRGPNRYFWLWIEEDFSDAEPAQTSQSLRQPISNSLRMNVYARDGFKCVWCGSDENQTIDHFIPVCAGGTNDFDNLFTVCKSCNSKKGKTIPGPENKWWPKPEVSKK